MHSILPKLTRQISPGLRRLMLLTLLLAISLPSFALTFTVDGIKYETIYSTTDNEVKVSVQPSTISGDIIIPASVTYDGRNYTVTQIVEHAFYFCDMMTSLSIPGSINLIDEDAIVGCKSMTSINVAPDNQIYASVDGVLYNKNVTELLCCPRGKKRYQSLRVSRQSEERASNFLTCTP